MKKKLLILVCLVFTIGTYVAVTGVQNSVLIQNVLACEDDEIDCSGDHDDGSGGGSYCALQCSSVPLQCHDSNCKIIDNGIRMKCGKKIYMCPSFGW